MKRILQAGIMAMIVFIVSCSDKTVPTASKVLNVNRQHVVDYAQSGNWAALPQKKDPSDSVPRPLINLDFPATDADVFFIHPTTFFNKALLSSDAAAEALPLDLWNASLDDSALNNKTDNSPILYQASIFNASGQVYAPRYRQANYSAYFSPDKAAAAKAFDFAYQDVKNAFEYYLQHYNNGRPIIIASHSQGTTHAKRLMREFFDGKPLATQLVAAYLVGMPVEKDYFVSIPVCTNPTQTGCFCSWRTLREGYLTEYIKKETLEVVVTNPLSWDTSAAPVGRNKNKGAVLSKFNKVLKNTTGGRVVNNVLWVNKPKFLGGFLLKRKDYHIGDLNLFYVNVRENIKQRITTYKLKNK